MSYQEFLNEIVEMMKTIYPKCKVEIIDVVKNNNVTLKGLVIRTKDTNVAPTIYMETFYKYYEGNGELLKTAMKIKDVYEKSLPPENLDMNFFRDFEMVKDRIVYRLINAEQNKELLKRIPHIRFWDLAICFSYLFSADELGEGTILIHHSHTAMWMTDTNALLKLAEENTPRLLPIQFCEIKNVLEQARVESDFDLDSLESGWMYVLTNTKKIHGATAILYPQTLNEIADMLKKDFFILPSSIHEVLILPVEGEGAPMIQIQEMCNLVACVNQTKLEPDEVLTNNPFYYSYKEKELKQLEPEK